MLAAQDAGMDDPQYLFIFPQLSLRLFGYNLTESQKSFLDGSAFVSALDGFTINEQNDTFLKAWRGVDDKWIHRLMTASPYLITEESKDFRTRLPARETSFVYDSTMALGIAACKMQQHQNQAKFATQEEYATMSNKTLLHYTSNLVFQGASGLVNLSESKTRQSTGLTVGIINARLQGDDIEQVVTSTKNGDGSWISISDFMYKGGVVQQPNLDLVVRRHNYLSGWVRTVGFTLYAAVVMFAIILLVALVIMRKDEPLRSTKKEDLILLCVSSLVMAQSMLLLSLDEKFVDDEAILDSACLSIPWLLFVSLMMTYSLLFCKFQKLNPRSLFRLKSKGVWTMWPFVIFSLSTIIILTVWTVKDQWQWERTFVSMDPPETYGRCHCDDIGAWLVPLVVIMMCAMAFAFLIMWRTKGISDDLSEKGTVYYTMCVHMQTLFLYSPISIVLNDTWADSIYFGRVLCIFVFSATPLVLVVGSQVINAFRIRRNPLLLQQPKRRNRLTSSQSRVDG